MGAFRLTKEMLYDVTGMGTGTPDETVISSVNVRLDDMFREAIAHCDHVIQLHGDDLEKLTKAGPLWREEAKTLSTPKFKFTNEEGISDRLLRDLNAAPAAFAEQIQLQGRLAFCHSPMFQYLRDRNTYTVNIWMHVVFAPH